MNIKKLKEIISGGESLTVEFKESRTKLNRDVFESVCAFLNRNGGHLFLGVNHNGGIIGVDKEAVETIKSNFVTSMNNPTKINPTFYLSVTEYEIQSKTILHIFIPESSQVHRCNGRIYDRIEDADIDITDNTNLVFALYYSEER